MRLPKVLILSLALALSACEQAPPDPNSDSAPEAVVEPAEAAPQKQTETVEPVPSEIIEQQNATTAAKHLTIKTAIDVGPDQQVDEFAKVKLSAKVTGAQEHEYYFRRPKWRQTAGPEIEIEDPYQAEISFFAPMVEKDTQLTFSYEVFQYRTADLVDSVTVTVKNVPGLPEVFAGEDIQIEESTPLTLYGYGQDANGRGVDFQWSIVPPGLQNLVLEDVTLPDARLIPPPVHLPQAVTLKLEVTDEQGRKAHDHITITIEPKPRAEMQLMDVKVPDPGLSACISNEADKYGWYYAKDVRRLRCDKRNIKSLSGLEYFYKLRWLDLRHNKIDNIDPIAHLPDMAYLQIDDNQVKDISALKYLKKLGYVGLAKNNIQSIAAVRDLPWLGVLNLSYNSIKDVSTLYQLRSTREKVRLYYNDLNCNLVSELEKQTKIEVMLKDNCTR